MAEGRGFLSCKNLLTVGLLLCLYQRIISYITPVGAKNMRGGQFLWENYMDQKQTAELIVLLLFQLIHSSTQQIGNRWFVKERI